MQQTPPPWRVLDEPEPPASGSAAGPAEPDATDPSRWPTASLSPTVLAGVAGALIVAAAAVAVALGGPRGTVVGPGDALGTSPVDAGVIVVVDVGGAVSRPGVYRLPAGSRIGDAVAAAGGFSPRVDVERAGDSLNLAALVHDGERVIVPSRDDAPVGGTGGEAGSGGPGGTTSTGRINLNTASQSELETLPGIGPVTAGKILAARAESPFRTVDELRDRGIVGPATFEKIRDLVSAG